MFTPLLRGWIAAFSFAIVLLLTLGCATAAEAPPTPAVAPVAADTASIQVVADLPSHAPRQQPEIASTDTILTPTLFPAATPLPTTTPLPTPTVTPEPIPEDYSTEEFRRFIDLKGLCGSGEGEYKAWDRATAWLEDYKKFDYKLINGLYGKHWDRTEQFYVDKRKLIKDFRYALSELEQVCLGL